MRNLSENKARKLKEEATEVDTPNGVRLVTPNRLEEFTHLPDEEPWAGELGAAALARKNAQDKAALVAAAKNAAANAKAAEEDAKAAAAALAAFEDGEDA